MTRVWSGYDFSWHKLPNYDFKKYYGGTSVLESTRFLKVTKWLQENHNRLEAELNADLNNGTLRADQLGKADPRTLIALWLGARYTEENFLKDVPHKHVPISMESGGDSLGFNHYSRIIIVGTTALESITSLPDCSRFVWAFNAGIHECTHGLRYSLGKKGALNEISAYYAQTTLGLPLKLDESTPSEWVKNEAGVRDPTQGGVYYWDEYLGFLVGAFLKRKDKKGDNIGIFRYFSLEHQDEPTIGSVFSDLFWYGKVSAPDYCKKMGIHDHGTIGRIEEVFNRMAGVYKTLIKMGKKSDDEHINALIEEMKKEFKTTPFEEGLPKGFGMASPNKSKDLRKVEPGGFMSDKA